MVRTCIPCHHHLGDPRVLDFLDIAAIDDISFPLDCSDSRSSSVSSEISERRSLCLIIVVMIVCHHLLRCFLLYFLQDWCHFYIHSDLQ
jgi:hypothetical protein